MKIKNLIITIIMLMLTQGCHHGFEIYPICDNVDNVSFILEPEIPLLSGCVLGFENGKWDSEPSWEFFTIVENAKIIIKEITYGRTPAGYEETRPPKELKPNKLYIIYLTKLKAREGMIFKLNEKNGKCEIEYGKEYGKEQLIGNVK